MNGKQVHKSGTRFRPKLSLESLEPRCLLAAHFVSAHPPVHSPGGPPPPTSLWLVHGSVSQGSFVRPHARESTRIVIQMRWVQNPPTQPTSIPRAAESFATTSFPSAPPSPAGRNSGFPSLASAETPRVTASPLTPSPVMGTRPESNVATDEVTRSLKQQPGLPLSSTPTSASPTATSGLGPFSSTMAAGGRGPLALSHSARRHRLSSDSTQTTLNVDMSSELNQAIVLDNEYGLFPALRDARRDLSAVIEQLARNRTADSISPSQIHSQDASWNARDVGTSAADDGLILLDANDARDFATRGEVDMAPLDELFARSDAAALPLLGWAREFELDTQARLDSWNMQTSIRTNPATNPARDSVLRDGPPVNGPRSTPVAAESPSDTPTKRPEGTTPAAELQKSAVIPASAE